MVKKEYLIPLLLLSFTASASEITLIKKDQPAPFEGYLFSEEKAREVRNIKLDLDYNVKQVTLLKDENLIISQRLDNYKAEAIRLSKEKADSNNSLLGTVGVFLLGGLTAALVAYGAARAGR